MKQLIKYVTATVIALSSFSLVSLPALAQIDYGSDDYTYDDYYTTSAVDDAAASTALAGFSMIFWLVFCCVMLVIMGGLAFVVYNDAKKNNVENGMLWAALTFFFGLIPLLIYFLAIKKNATGGSTPAAK